MKMYVDVGSTNSRRVYSMSVLRHIGTYCAYTHAYIPVSTMHQDNMMQLSKLLLTGCQFSSVRKSQFSSVPIEYGGHVTRCSISSFVTGGLWSRSGYRGGRDSETKGNALAREDRVKVVVIAGWLSTGRHCIFKTFHRCFVNIYRYGVKSPARTEALKSMSSVHIVTSILVNDSFFCSSFFCFNDTNASIRSFIFLPINDSFKCIEGPLSKFQLRAPHNLDPPLASMAYFMCDGACHAQYCIYSNRRGF